MTKPAGPYSFPRLRRNQTARKAVLAYPMAIDSRSDNIALLAVNLAAMRPFLKDNR